MSPALAAQLRAFSVISSSLRAELSTSRNHYVGKVSAFADVFFDRSHPLTGCQRYCGRRRLPRHRPLPQCLSGRGSLIHASQALRPEKRGSPLPIGRTGTDSITLTLHCVRTRPAGEEVRLRLDFFDARFILSGSVVHFVPDTSSEGERRCETVTDGVPFTLHIVSHRLAERNRSVGTPLLVVPGLYAPGASVPPLRLRDLRRLRRAHWSRLRSRLQSLRLHSVTQAPSAAGPAHTSEMCCRSTLIQLSVQEPERPLTLASTVVPSGSCRACRLACSLSGRQKERC